jgi:hypothetical protein
MADINSDTKVTLTMTQFILGICVLLGGAWGILQYTTSGVRDDVNVIRQAVPSLQTADKDGVRRVGETDLKLTNEIGLLRTSVVALDGRIATWSAKFDNADKSFTELSNQMGDLRKQLITRQQVWNDPKAVQSFANALKNSGIEEQKIIIVPFDGSLKQGQ